MLNKLRLGRVLFVPLLAWLIDYGHVPHYPIPSSTAIAATPANKPAVDTPPGESIYERIAKRTVSFVQARSILEANHVPVIATASQQQLRAKIRQQPNSKLNRSTVEALLKKPGLLVYRRTSLKCTWQVSTRVPVAGAAFAVVYSNLWGYVSNNKFKRSGEMIVSPAPPAFAKVKDGMSYNQVKSILGKPSEEVQEIVTGYMWKNSAGSILEVFFNNDQLASIGVLGPDGKQNQ